MNKGISVNVVTMTETKEIATELKKIETDIESLKILLIKRRKMPRKIAKLEGSLTIKISEEDIEEAKKSLFESSD